MTWSHNRFPRTPFFNAAGECKSSWGCVTAPGCAVMMMIMMMIESKKKTKKETLKQHTRTHFLLFLNNIELSEVCPMCPGTVFMHKPQAKSRTHPRDIPKGVCPGLCFYAFWVMFSKRTPNGISRQKGLPKTGPKQSQKRDGVVHIFFDPKWGPKRVQT